MRGIAFTFDGSKRTHINWDESLSGQPLVVQKYLLNIVTENNSDRIFPNRGTKLLSGAIGGAIVSRSALYKLSEAAATDTLYFCSYEEYKDVYNAGWYPTQVQLNTTDVDVYAQEVSLSVDFNMRDGTALKQKNMFTNNG